MKAIMSLHCLTLIPLSTSFINFIRWSFWDICATWNKMGCIWFFLWKHFPHYCPLSWHYELHRHQTSAQASQITDNSTVCSTVCLTNFFKNIKALHYWFFMRGIHQLLVDSLTKDQQWGNCLGIMMSLQNIKSPPWSHDSTLPAVYVGTWP